MPFVGLLMMFCLFTILTSRNMYLLAAGRDWGWQPLDGSNRGKGMGEGRNEVFWPGVGFVKWIRRNS